MDLSVERMLDRGTCANIGVFSITVLPLLNILIAVFSGKAVSYIKV